MRSGDGDRSFLLSICSLIFLSLALNASEYLISYRYVVKNAILYNEKLQISPSMQQCQGKLHQGIMLSTDNSNDLKKIILANKEEFVQYLHRLGLHVTHRSLTTNLQQSSTTTLTLPTTCFKVDFNDNFATIAPIK